MSRPIRDDHTLGIGSAEPPRPTRQSCEFHTWYPPPSFLRHAGAKAGTHGRQIPRLRPLFDAGETQRSVALSYNVSQSTISRLAA
jgi:hypothetical protein